VNSRLVMGQIGARHSRGVRGTSALPPILTVTADIPDRQLGANSGREQMQQHRDYSITSSARSRIDVGTSMPMVRAVLRLTIVVNFIARSTGRSAGFAPLRILSTKTAARQSISGKFIP
jgi:hypothetical protein